MTTRLVSVVSGALAGVSACLATEFNPKMVPADAKWVVHLDVDSLVKTPFWEIVEDRLNTNAGAQAKLQELETVTGIVFPDNLHGVTLVGMGFDDADGVVILTAKANQEQLRQMLQGSPAYSDTPHGKFEILSWEDKGKVMYGSFYSADVIIIAQNKANVATTIDAMSGEGPSISDKSVLSLPTGQGIVAGVAGDGLSALAAKDKKNPVLRTLKAGWISAATKDQNVVLTSSMDFGDAKTAQQMKAMGEGLKAAGLYMATTENADPKVKLIAPLLPGAQLSSKDNLVHIEWTAPADDVKSVLLQVIDAKEKAKAKAAK